RLRATADALPSTETLPRQLHRLADRLDTESLESFLSPLTVHMPTRQPVGGNVTCCRRTGPVCRQSIGVYSGRRRKRSDNAALADRLATTLGASPPDWQTLLWFARWNMRGGEGERTEAMLQAGADVLNGHAPWVQLPLALIVDPDLR